MAHNTTPFLLNLNPIEVREPRISNDEFLDSLDTIGVWLRVLSAYDSFERFISPDSTSIQRLASLSNIYLQLGAQLEDQAVSLIAFSVWSQDRDLVLADLFSRVFVRHYTKPKQESEVQMVHTKLKSRNSKSVSVNQKEFFREVADSDDVEIVRFCLGYRWRPIPSVKLIPKRHSDAWRGLPGELRRIAGSFCEEGQVPRVAVAYNKLKHGPQLIIQNPVDRANKFSISPEMIEQLSRFKSFDKPSVRLLFGGASTQGGVANESARSVAPFLIGDIDAVSKLFFGTMVHQANLFSMLVKMQIALYRKEHIDLDNLDEGVSRIIKAQGQYLAKG